MDVKSLNSEPNPLSEKIIDVGVTPFKLWLEFEVTSPWEDLENDFVNVCVHTLDGRLYGLSVWTFKFLKSAIEYNAKMDDNLDGLYQIPPDLFVKELTRDCIERTIVDLLKKGDLEKVLNPSIFGIEFLEPYSDAIEMEEEMEQKLMHELNLELPDGHLLYGESVELMAKKTNNDDIVLELENGKIAVVQLTWKSEKETDTSFPTTRIYKDRLNFWNQEMRQDILEFKASK